MIYLQGDFLHDLFPKKVMGLPEGAGDRVLFLKIRNIWGLSFSQISTRINNSILRLDFMANDKNRPRPVSFRAKDQ